MRKNIGNDKVIRAITIGLATMMAATSMPLTVFAEDGTEPAADTEENKYSATAETESTTADSARQAVDSADASAATVVGDVNTNVVSGEAGKTEINGTEVDNAAAVKNSIPVYDVEGNLIIPSGIKNDIQAANDALAAVDANLTIVENYLKSENISKVSGSGFDEALNANMQAYRAAVAAYGIDGPVVPEDMEDGPDKEALKAAKASFDKLNAWILGSHDSYNDPIIKKMVEEVRASVSQTTANGKVDDAIANGKDLAGKAADEQTAANDAGSEAETLAKETEEKFNEYVESIKKAPTIAATNKAYEDLVALLNDADTTLEDKQKAYDAAKKNYDEYLEQYKNEQDNVAAAQAEYDAALEAYNTASGKYSDYDAAHTTKVNDLTNYHTSLQSAYANLETAKGKLADAKEKADSLAAAVETAKAAVLLDNAGAYDIVEKITICDDSEKSVSAENDALFESIMRNYYFGKHGIPSDALMVWNWDKQNGGEGSAGAKYNYCVVTYVDEEGATQTKYYNYTLENKNQPGGDRLYIFEKTDKEVDVNRKLVANPDSTLYEDGFAVDRYKINDEEKQFTEETLQKRIADGEIVNVNGIYYKQKESTGTTGVTVLYNAETGLVSDITSVVGDVDVRTVVTIGTDTVEGTFKKDSTGNVVKEFTADETTVVYHKASLSSDIDDNEHYTFSSEKEAQEALSKAYSENFVSGDEVISNKVVLEKHEEEYTDYEDAKKEVDIYRYQASLESVDSSFETTIDLTKVSSYTIGWIGAFTGGHYSVNDVAKDVEAAGNNSSYKLATGGEYIENDKKYYVVSAGDVEACVTNKNDVLISNDSWLDLYGEVKVKAVQKVTLAEIKTCEAKLLKHDLKRFLPNYSELNKGQGNNDNTSFVTALKEYLARGGSLAGTGYLYINVNDDGTISYVKGAGTTYGDVFEAKTVLKENGDIDLEATEAAKAEAQRLALESLGNASGATVNDLDSRKENADYKKAVTKTKEVTTYGYSLELWKKQSESTENIVVKTDVYGDAKKVYGQVNQNVNEKKDFKQSEDVEFNKFINDAVALKEKYERLSKEAKKAQQDVVDAQTAVNELENIIKTTPRNDPWGKPIKGVHGLGIYDLLDGVSKNDATLEELEAFLEDALAQLNDAKAKLKDLQDQMDDVEKERDKRIAALTPTPEEERRPSGGRSGDDSGVVDTIITPIGALTLPTTGVAGARVARVAGIAGIDAGEDEATGVAGVRVDKPEEEDKIPVIDATKVDNKKPVKLDDIETPLAAVPVDSSKMNWWWLVVVALLGATGYEMYKKHEEKKNAEAAVADSIKKEN